MKYAKKIHAISITVLMVPWVWMDGSVEASTPSLHTSFAQEYVSELEAVNEGDQEAIQFLADVVANALENDPHDAEARLWQGALQLVQARHALSRSDLNQAFNLYRQGMTAMAEGVEQAPGNVAIRATRGRLLLQTANSVPPYMVSEPLRLVVSDLAFVIEHLGDRLDELSVDEQGVLLIGMAQALNRLNRPEEAKDYAQRVLTNLPGTSHAARAEQMLAEVVSEQAESSDELTENARIHGLAILWSEISYNFAHFDKIPEVDWDQVFVEYLPKVRETDTLEAYYRVLQRCVAQLRDGHTGVNIVPARIGLDRPAVRIEPIEDKAVITALANDIDNLAVGDAITHIDGEPVQQVLALLYPLIPDFTPQGRNQRAYQRLLEGPIQEPVAIRVVSPGGAAREVTLQQGDFSSYPRINRSHAAEQVPEDLGYVWLNTFGNSRVVDQFEEQLLELLDAEGLILDLRDNGGGSSLLANQIIARLIDEPIPGLQGGTPQHRAAERAHGMSMGWHDSGEWSLDPAEGPRYRGPIVILTNAGTVSAGEDFVAMLHGANRATVIGQPTAGTTGQLLRVDLPGGIRLGICTRDTRYADGRSIIGRGIQPDIEVHLTQQDIAKGDDPVLIKAIEVLRNQSR